MATFQTINDDYDVQVTLDKDFTLRWLKLWLYSPELKMLCQLYRSGAKNIIPRKQDLKKMVFSNS
jgi:hypothetical protein